MNGAQKEVWAEGHARLIRQYEQFIRQRDEAAKYARRLLNSGASPCQLLDVAAVDRELVHGLRYLSSRLRSIARDN